MHNQAVVEILQQQAGVITFQQAKDAGLTRAQVRYRERIGEWERAHRGIYRHALVGRTYRGDLWLGILATGGVVSHRSAADLHGFEELGRVRKRPEISVPHGTWRPVEGVVVHQTTQIDRIDVVTIDGLPCTGGGRFLAQIDLAYPTAMLAIELDSVSKHNNFDSFHSDRSRARGLTVDSWSVLQFTWKDYTKDPAGIVRQVRGILSRVMAA